MENSFVLTKETENFARAILLSGTGTLVIITRSKGQLSKIKRIIIARLN